MWFYVTLKTVCVVIVGIIYTTLVASSKMFKIKELVYKTNIFKIPALQYFPVAYKKRHKHTESSDDRKVEENDSKPLVKHCLLLGYSGSKYSGMQLQTTRDVVTVEGMLLKAMLENNWIQMASYKQPKSIKFQEGSRTDKGVSATRQCCSILLPAGLDVNEVNKNLPDDVRVFGLKRVTNKFNARLFCESRTYTYTLPTVAFCHFNDQVSQREYRLTADKLTLVNELLQVYKGSKNFHNFTKQKTFSEDSCIRQMKHLECGPPFIVDDVEFCQIRIQGNSFMMYQIRKMVGLMLAVIRKVVDSNIFETAFTEQIVNCPTAPGLGLVLDRQHYDVYDRHYGSDGQYEKLTWEECDVDVQQFHEKHIRSTILQTEIQNEDMLQWLEFLLNYAYVPVVDGDSRPASHIAYVH